MLYIYYSTRMFLSWILFPNTKNCFLRRILNQGGGKNIKGNHNHNYVKYFQNVSDLASRAPLGHNLGDLEYHFLQLTTV